MKLLTDGQGKAVRRSVGKNSGQRRPKALEQLIRAMKLTCVLLTVAFLHVSAGSFSQQVTLSLKDAPIEKVFREIERQTGYGFLYNKQMFANFPNVTLNMRNADISEVLDRCLHGSAVDYVVNDQTIVIREKTNVESGTPAQATPPSDIHGRITDSLGNPLEGVNVVVKGSKKGAQTGANGEFTLKGVDNEATLVISNVGYETREIRLAGRQDIRITMRESVKSLVDVVVNKGYYSTTERLNTGDVTTVKGEDIQKQPVSDPIQALEGRVPGLNIIQTSGIAGSYGSITIRGQNSIANGNDPLYIVDGVPFSSTSLTSPFIGGGALGTPVGVSNYTGSSNAIGSGMSPFNSLNPADIESIEVLKDADATAIYGSRGANGVILITTKKGKAGDTRFDANVFSGEGKVARTMHLFNTQQYMQMMHEAYQNDGLTFPNINTNPYDNYYDIDGVWDTTRYTNWQKVLIGNPAHFTNAQANVSGGNVNTQFVLGGGYSNQGTVYPGSYADIRASAHVNLTHSSADKKFHAQFSTSYTNDNSDLPQTDFTSQITLSPDAPALYDSKGNINWQMYNGSSTYSNNPIASTLMSAKAVTDNLIGNLNLGYQVLPGLDIKSSFGYTHEQMNQTILSPAAAYAPPTNTLASARRNDLSTSDVKTWIIEPQVNYQRKVLNGVLQFLLGSTFQESNNNSVAYLANTFPSDALITDVAAASNVGLSGVNNTIYKYNAVYGRFSYDWREKYLVNITARRDGSSNFGPGKQFGDFGAIGAAWIFSKERFMENSLPFISFGKLRGSYGTTGNDQITPYQYLSTYTASSYSYQGISVLGPTQLTNPNFAWEVVKKLEGALDLGFFKDRLLLSTAYYRDRTGNQLVGYPLPYISGFHTVQYNLPAVVQNSGWEFTLTSTNVKTKDFSWMTNVNLSIPSNKLVSYPNLAISPYKYTYVVGQSLFIKEVYHSSGVNSQTGLYSFTTKNANGQPTSPQDAIASKPVTQSLYGGLENSFSYKGFRLDFLFQFVKQLRFNYQESLVEPGTDGFNQPTYVLGRWQSAGELKGTQRFGTTNATSNPFAWFQNSDRVISDGSFIRLKNVALSYEFPADLKSKSHLRNARIYIQCQNLLTFTKYQGMDPESGGLNLPPLRMVTGGIQIAL